LEYRVEIRRAAQKQSLALPREAQVAVALMIDNLATAQRPAGCRKLRESGLWRVRNGRYGVVYSIDDANRAVTVVKVALRQEDTYKEP
jgi:mRNA interferase RelE/StbE